MEQGWRRCFYVFRLEGEKGDVLQRLNVVTALICFMAVMDIREAC